MPRLEAGTNEGRFAFREGLTKKDCPYKTPCKERTRWLAGWIHENELAQQNESQSQQQEKETM